MARARHVAGVAIAALASIAAGACSTYRDGPAPPTDDCAGDAAAGYPSCPYGTTVGDVVANATFVGFPRLADTAPQPLSLADLYAPGASAQGAGGAGASEAGADAGPDGASTDGDAGDAAVGDGAVPGGVAPKTPWIFVDVSARWCAPCREEGLELPALSQRFAGQVTFVTIIFQGVDQSGGVTTDDARAWRDALGLDFWTVADPSGASLAYFSRTSPPYSMVIDARTMKIAAQIVGKPSDTGQFIRQAIGAN